MTEWEPATEVEAAMRDALRAHDQERYFRILARTDLLLPVAQPTAGQAPTGWGTWTSGGRTHVLAFTSATALRACLGESAGGHRRTPYAELAAGWPNPEWWLAVNPGLPIEGYLPAWYVAQLSRGDVRLPGRTLGARARLERVESLARARAAATGRDTSPSPVTGPGAAPSPDAGAVGLPGRTSFRGAAPTAGLPLVETAGPASRVPSPAPAPAPAALPRRSGDAPPAAWRPSGADPAPTTGGERPTPPPPFLAPGGRPGPDPGRPLATRPGAVEAAGGNGTRAGGPAEPPRRSFFEPASGRRSASRDPADRAAPPSRFGRSDQPFPRRGPVDGPKDAEATQAFFTPARQPTPAPRPSSGGGRAGDSAEATQPLRYRRPDPQADEPTRAFGLSVPPPPPGRRPGTDLGGEPTQPLPPRPRVEPDPGPVEELPPSAAEPVSGPPAPRRGFTPIVIEGTIVESRDLDPPGAGGPGTAASAGPSTAGSGGRTEGADPWTAAPRARSGEADFWSASRPTSPAGAGTTGTSAGGTTATSAGGALWTAGASGDVSATRAGSPGSEDATVNLGVPAGSTATTTTSPARAGNDERPSPVPAPGGSAAGAARDTSAAESRAATTDDSATSASGPTAGGPTTGTSAGAAGTPDPAADAGTSHPAAGGAPVTSDPAAAGTPGTSPTAGTSPTGSAAPDRAGQPAVEFQPANAVEEDLLTAAGAGSTDTFLSTLLLARVLLPVAAGSAPGSRPGDPGFVWRTEELDGETFVVVYTSAERMADHVDGGVETVQVKFVQLIRRWPDEAWSFAVNPGTPVGAKLPGEQIIGLANWAAEVGLGDDTEFEDAAAVTEPVERPRSTPKPADPSRPVLMQKAVAPSQVAYYLERGYDRVSGFVHRAPEVAHLNTPAKLYDALGLGYPDSPFSRDAEEIYVLRWPAYRPSLYRIPYGGQTEAAMRAMEGWVIERPPFRGNGFAPGESSDVVAEFKVDSARLPHGAQLWRIGADGTERVVAVLDSDALRWREVEAQ
ncbi:SseB family protein [Micromonospora globbae]|uniref:SseB family protein n=1 Tax=Micromonospora globbae TaxID=1894969 RepID=UPI003441E960